MNDVVIIPFQPSHQPGVDALLKSIEEEYEEDFYSPGGKKMGELCLLPDRWYWVAIAGNKLIGTVGIIVQHEYATLKSMFLHIDNRSTTLAADLLHIAENKSKSEGCEWMYLGTMQQFMAAQRFYQKHEFVHIPEAGLPPNFPGNVVDTIFFKKRLL